MGIYIEALILYIVLFFSGSTGSIAGTEVSQSFSIARELVRIFMYTLPSIALIWYILLRARKLREWNIRPGKKDLISCLITLPCLIITGLVIAFAASKVGEPAIQISLHSPSTALEWVILCISCICAAYLEESFFRFYLLGRREELKLNYVQALVLSVALFSVCHLYEGPWGVLNAVISGTILAFIFIRYKSLHGIAIAHSLYNIAVYVINTIQL